MEEKLELYLDTKELIKALEFTTKVLKSKPTSEIYAFNKFIANKDKVDIEAVEMYEAAKTSVKAKVDGEGEFIIDPKQLLMMLKNVDIDEIIITKEPEKITLKSKMDGMSPACLSVISKVIQAFLILTTQNKLKFVPKNLKN